MEKNKPRAALVTGASSGIGLAISRKLGALGYEVLGIGRNFGKEPLWQQAGFHPLVCDVTDTAALCACARQAADQYAVHVLVNNAGVGYYGLHEELNPNRIREMVRTNLEAPMILTAQLLRHLKNNAGTVINIASVTAHGTNPHGCAYGATKAGLASFSRSLFDEARNYGLRVTCICPDMTKTNLYRNADFREGEDAASYLLPQEIAEAVEYVLSQRDGVDITELTIRPQIHRMKRK